MKTFIDNSNGITLKELKEFINGLPETNEDGDPFEVWIETEDGLSGIVTTVWQLNKSKSGCDILIGRLDYEK